MNGKIFARGSKRDYDDWAHYLGDEGWGWDSMLQYLKKTETFVPPIGSFQARSNLTWNPDVHGSNGPITATFAMQYWPSTNYIIAAEKSLGIPQKHDQADGDPVGGIWFPSSIRAEEYTRSYSKREYYDVAKAWGNLHLLADTTVTRILFDGETAVGVEVRTVIHCVM